jgi:4-amino-4-deoxy-L-arabinose transferase-like glycosyltransferase
MRVVSRSWLGLQPLLLPIAMTLVLHLLAGTRYGLFRDELYYISCAWHLDWAYVDHPGLSVWLLRGAMTLLGHNDPTIRQLSLVIALISVASVGWLTRVMGGNERAQLLAALAVAAAPVFRVTGLFYSPNTLDLPLWVLVIVAWRSAVGAKASLANWALFGLAFGVAANNRLSAGWLLAALLVATVIMRPRLDWRGVGLAVVISAGMMVPWLRWQLNHHWATLEFLRNANLRKLMPVPGWQFVATQVAVMGILSLPIWLGGVAHGLRTKEFRAYGFAFLTVAAILLAIGRSRENYLSPAYAFVLPVGAIWLEERLGKWFQGYSVALAASGVGFALICMPILDPPVLAAILAKFPSPPSTEKGPKSVLQGLSDTIGWRHFAVTVKRAWLKIPQKKRGGVAILTYNYGEAAAMQRCSAGMPTAICGHNQYWLVGPRGWDGKRAVLVGAWPEEFLRRFEHVEIIGQNDDPWSTPEEGSAMVRYATGGNIDWASVRRFE